MMAKKQKNFEESLEELESIVDVLEKGDLSLDESMKLFSKGMELSKYCSNKLTEAQKQISVLIKGENGEMLETDFNMEGK